VFNRHRHAVNDAGKRTSCEKNAGSTGRTYERIMDEIERTAKRAARRHHALRIVRKRLFIARNLMSSPPYTYSLVPGRLRKWNFSCNCYLCKGDKKLGLETLKEKCVCLNEDDWQNTPS
jgi:hypothetical protein